MPNDIHEFDLVRIERDIEQYRELISRIRWVWENETDPDRKAELIEEMSILDDRLSQIQTLLQQ